VSNSGWEVAALKRRILRHETVLNRLETAQQPLDDGLAAMDRMREDLTAMHCRIKALTGENRQAT
jgi:hypothetical protein